MPNIPIHLTCADYARVMPLVTGEVKPDGIDLTVVHGSGGSWALRAEMLRRALQDRTVDGGEASMAGHLRRLDRGDRSFVGLPVFPLRNFTARDLYVRKEGPIKAPGDLIGRRVGMYDWVASGSIWYRHFLRFIGVPPEKLEWWISDIDDPRAQTHVYELPAGVRRAPEGVALADVLVEGEIEAVYSPSRPKRYHPTEGPIVRLFADIRAVERDYFARTQMFPPQHLIILRREVWEANRGIARHLTDAFIRANQVFAQSVRSFPYVSPWLDAELEETEAVMGADFHPYGFEPNRRALEVFCETAHSLGITTRPVTAEEYFAEYLAS
jgi:4,5-dihydroxyphthalate decarboxylase